MAKAACYGKAVDADARYSYDAACSYEHGLGHMDFNHAFFNINTDRAWIS